MRIFLKNIKKDLKNLLLPGCAYVCGVIFISCTAPSVQWKAELLYTSSELESNRLSTGNSILFLPLITRDGFDTSRTLSPEALTKSLVATQGKLKLFFKKDFEESFLPRNSRELLDSLYASLFRNDILALHAVDTVWKTIPARFVIVLRLNTGVRIKSFDGIVKRKAELEGELWDTKRIEIVWRAQSSGYQMDTKITDAEFISRGVREIFNLLPEFIPVRDEEDW